MEEEHFQQNIVNTMKWAFVVVPESLKMSFALTFQPSSKTWHTIVGKWRLGLLLNLQLHHHNHRHVLSFRQHEKVLVWTKTQNFPLIGRGVLGHSK